jgi:hypothetical protein
VGYGRRYRRPAGAFTHLDLNYVNQMGCHVDFNLTEADLQTLFEIAEELAMFHEVFDIYHDPHQIVRKDLFLMPPPPSNDLGFPRDCAKVVFQFNERVGD